MNKYIQKLIHRVLIYSFIALLFQACSPSPSIVENGFPENGTWYLQRNNSKSEFIRLEFKNGKVEGNFFMEEEYYGKVYYKFKGKVLSDTVLQTLMAYSTDDIDRDWLIHKNGNTVSISNILDRTEICIYTLIDSSAMPPISDYASVADIEKINAEDMGDSPIVCFYSYYPGGNKRTVFREYIQLWNEDEFVSGKGAGYSEGDPEWSFTFSGNLTNDTILELNATYKQDGKSPFSTSETWVLDLNKGFIRIKEQGPRELRSISSGEYHQVDCDAVPEDLKSLIKRLNE